MVLEDLDGDGTDKIDQDWRWVMSWISDKYGTTVERSNKSLQKLPCLSQAPT
jgi:hypothetical protein